MTRNQNKTTAWLSRCLFTFVHFSFSQPFSCFFFFLYQFSSDPSPFSPIRLPLTFILLFLPPTFLRHSFPPTCFLLFLLLFLLPAFPFSRPLFLLSADPYFPLPSTHFPLTLLSFPPTCFPLILLFLFLLPAFLRPISSFSSRSLSSDPSLPFHLFNGVISFYASVLTLMARRPILLFSSSSVVYISSLLSNAFNLFSVFLECVASSFLLFLSIV